MAELTAEEKLAMLVRAEVAVIRARRAKDRAALLDRKMQPLNDAHERFRALYRREPDPDRDLATIMDLAMQIDEALRLGFGDLRGEDWEASIAATGEYLAAERESVEAMRAVRDAWGGRGGTPLGWAGVDAETYRRALEKALQEG